MRFEKVSEEQYLKDTIGDMPVNFEIMSAILQEYRDIKLPARAHKGTLGMTSSLPLTLP